MVNKEIKIWWECPTERFYLGNSQEGIPGWIEITTTVGREPTAEKLRAEQSKDEYKQKQDG